MVAPVYLKNPAAVLDHVEDWSDWLGGDTIASSSWEISGGADSPPALALDSDVHNDTTATGWLSGGTAGVDYLAANRIVTAGGRTDERTLRIHVRDNL